jgi:hypothetical protein
MSETPLAKLARLQVAKDALYSPGPCAQWHLPPERRQEFHRIASELIALARELGIWRQHNANS